MPGQSNMRSGGRILVDQLVIQGVDTVFCVPGESYLAALDAFHDTPSIRIITCRHEANAANMAEAYGKMTGKPGVCFVTRGPGACHAVIGLHTAFQDSTPLVLFVGQVARSMIEREAFQEMDFRRFFGQVSKWSGEIIEAARIPELVSQAFHRATSGRPGPTVLSLPEDMLTDLTDAADARHHVPAQAHPGTADMNRLRDMLAAAKRPILMLGGGTWTPQAVDDIAAFATANDLPTTCAFRNQDRMDNRLPQYVGEVGIGGNPDLIRKLKETDLLIVAGPRVGEQTSQGYTLLDLPVPRQPVVHIHPDPEELGRVFQPTLGINAGMPQFAAAAKALAPVDASAWTEFRKEARLSYEANLEIKPSTGKVDMAEVMAVLREQLPADAVIANDAGNFSGWAHRYLPFTRYPSQVGPTSGAMGYGVPAAIAAALVAPERTVVGFAGDGGFLMSSNELATCAQYDIRPIIILVNNGMYGTIRMHQAREFPDRYVATDLANPDFAAYARSFGLFGETVQASADFAPALERAMAAGTAAVIELQTDPEAINTRTTLTAIRDAAVKRQGA